MIPALEALELLQTGNRNFAAGTPQRTTIDLDRRSELVAGQQPHAVILGCSDSRVPAEIIFDQGLGDLFVVRVAGNIAAPSLVGSVEFAAGKLGTRLVVVLGHSGCGAVTATVEALTSKSESGSPNLSSIVDHIRPSVEGLLYTDLQHEPDRLIAQAIRANVQATANHLRHDSQLLENLIRNDGLLVVGAEYSLETGLVDFFDGLPENV